MALDQFIIDLLKTNDCVVVPQFGGFIANYQSAVIDHGKQKIFPPSKQVLFNPRLVNNDGLLANYVSHAKSVTYESSLVYIDETVEDWRQKLKADKRIEFGEIGYLFEKDGQIQFEQNREVNLLLSAYGLSSIRFVEAKAEPEPEIVVEENTVIEEKETTPVFTLSEKATIVAESKQQEKETIVVPIQKTKKSRRRIGYAVAAACILPALFYTYWIPMETDFLSTGNIQLSDFNPFVSQKVKQYEIRLETTGFKTIEEEESFESKLESIPGDVKIYQYQFDEELYIPVRINDEVPLTDITLPTEVQDKEMIADVADDSAVDIENNANLSQARVQIIAGCFSVKENADLLVNQLKSSGYPAFILDQKNGLHRVSAGGFETVAKTEAVREDLKSQNIATWVLKQ